MAKLKKAPVNGFDKDPERARLAGQKSSRALPAEIKLARAYNAAAFEGLVYSYLEKKPEELIELQAAGNLSAREEIIIAIILKSAEGADVIRTNFLLDRTIGKVTEKIDHTVETKPSVHKRFDGSEYEFTNKPKGE